MGRVRQFHDALFAQPAPPCEEFKCEHLSKCATKKLACKAFSDYVWNSTVRPSRSLPNRARYKALSTEHPRVQARNRVVTHKPTERCDTDG